ncbi:MAG: glutamine amidotransferase [Planctomycetota bacterium]
MNFTLIYKWHPISMLTICFTVAILVFLFHRRIYHTIQRKKAVLLIVVKTIIVLFLLLCLFVPVLSFQSRSTDKTGLIVLIDSSESMLIKDCIGELSRSETANKILFDEDAGIFRQLNNIFNIRLFSFSVSPELVTPDSLNKISTHGKTTSISKSVSEAVSLSGDNFPVAVLIISDGADNSFETTGLSTKIPVFTIGVGTKLSQLSGFMDISVRLKQAPETVFKNSKVEVTVNIKNQGFPSDTSLPVALKCVDGENEAVDTAIVKFTNHQDIHEVTLSFVPRETGVFEYEISCPPDENELIKENNSAFFTLRVIDTELKVLVIDTPRWEYKFLKQILERDENIDVTGVVLTTVNQFTVQGKGDLSEVVRGLPENEKALAAFDIVVIGDIPRSVFNNSQLIALKNYVANGGNFIVLGGESILTSTNYQNTPVEELLPLALSKNAVGREVGEFKPLLTEEGKKHPVFNGCSQFFTLSESACNVNSIMRTGILKPGTVVLLESSSDSAGENLPVIAIQQYGEGKSMVVATDETYKWHLKNIGMGQDSPCSKFWGQTVRWLANKEADSKEIMLWTNKLIYTHGEKVAIFARVDETKLKLDETDVLPVQIILSSGETKIEHLAKNNIGEFKTIYLPSGEGRYEVSATVLGIDNTIVSKKAVFVIGNKTTEFEEPDMNDIFLQKISNETRGKYYSVLEAKKAAEEIENTVSVALEQKEYAIWDTPVFFLVFILLLTFEWIIRKRFMLM